MLRRYWIEFDSATADALPVGTRSGCGVTAGDLESALALVKRQVFEGRELPRTKNVVADVDVSHLDQRHVVPNMGNPAVAGIWFPLGYGVQEAKR